MTIKASKHRHSSIALTITLILSVTIAFVLSSGFSQSKNRINTEAIIQGLKQPTLPTSVTSINETNSLNSTNSYSNYSSTPPKKDLVSLDTLNSTVYEHPDMSGFFFLPPDKTQQGQITGSELSLQTNVININVSVPIFVRLLRIRYIYIWRLSCLNSQIRPISFFPFQIILGQGQVAGSDALAWNFYAIQKLDFDAAFIAPKVSALGFDEMAIFATSNTITYKGTEFGIRMDLKDGLIYGYIQEPNGNNGEVNFRMMDLMPNDGVIHHYTLVMLGTGVSFCIDGIQYGYSEFSQQH